jgi:hypothetical protein
MGKLKKRFKVTFKGPNDSDDEEMKVAGRDALPKDAPKDAELKNAWMFEYDKWTAEDWADA